MIGVEIDVGEQPFVLCCGVLGEHPGELSQLAHEELEVDLERLAKAGAVAPGSASATCRIFSCMPIA